MDFNIEHRELQISLGPYVTVLDKFAMYFYQYIICEYSIFLIIFYHGNITLF